MKRGTRITLLTLAVVLSLGIVAEGGLNAVLSHIASRRVNKALASIPDCEASCGRIQVGVFTGTVEVEDVRFVYQGQQDSTQKAKGKHVPSSQITVDRIKAGRVFLFKLKNKEALVQSIQIVRPKVELWMDEDHPELSFPKFEVDTTMLKLMHPLKRAELMNLHIEEASFALHSTRTPLDVKVEDCSTWRTTLLSISATHCISSR